MINLFLLILSFQLFAIDGRRCDSLINRKGGFNNLPLSTSQFTSSTGECSALGSTNEYKKNYYYANYERIRTDVAKGSGDTIEAFLELGKCSNKQRTKIFLKKNFESIYILNIEDSYNFLNSIVTTSCKA